MDSRLRAVIVNIQALQEKYDCLEDRIAVMEEITCDVETRLEDLEKSVEILQDEVDEY